MNLPGRRVEIRAAMTGDGDGLDPGTRRDRPSEIGFMVPMCIQPLDINARR